MYKCSKCDDFCSSDDILLMQHEKTCCGEKQKIVIDGTTELQTLSFNNLIFIPEKDITAYELAWCLGVIMIPYNQQGSYFLYNSLPPECKRHFKEIN